MRTLAMIAVASLFAASGAASGALASLSATDGPAWQPKAAVEVAARGDGRGDRNGSSRSRDVQRDKQGGKVIWRHRGKHERPFFLFRGRGDCATRTVEVPDDSGNIVLRNRWVCH